jgi:hypothetical protein
MFYEMLKNTNKIVNNIKIQFVQDPIFNEHKLDTVPFPQCKIMEVWHYPYFAPRPTMPRYFELRGDKSFSNEASREQRRYWLPLTPEDDWTSLIRKADMLAELSGDRHHVYLEGFEVFGEILSPCFGS